MPLALRIFQDNSRQLAPTYREIQFAKATCMHPLSLFARPAGLLLAASAVSILLAPVPASCQSSAAQTGPVASASTVLRANTNLVLVDVVVTDHDRPVPHLDQRRFHILEDGREQTIASFEEHQPNPSPAATSQPPVLPPLPPHTFTNQPLYPPEPAVNVLLLDGLNTPLSNQIDVRRQMLQFMGKIAPGTQLAVFTLSSRLRMVTGFTTDPAILIRDLKGPKTNPQPSVILDPQGAQALDSATGDMAAMGAGAADPAAVAAGVPNALSMMQQFEADVTAFQTDQRVSMTLEAMQQLARYLSAIPGRKNLIWFSGSFPIALDPDDSLQSPFEAMRNYSDQIKDTAELLSAARVAVYPVDARGLMTSPIYDASYTASSNLVGGGSSRRRGGSASSPMNRANPGKDDQKFNQQLMAEQASMQQIADQTGGREYLNTNGLKEAVADAVKTGSSYYTIGYIPTAKNFDGGYRKLQIRIDDSNDKLAYRHGYFADDPEKPSSRAPGETSLIMAATLHGAPPSTQILFKAQVLSADDPLLQHERLPQGPAGELTAQLKGPIHRYIVDLRIDAASAHGLTFEAQPDARHLAKVEYSLVAYDAEGKRLNYYDVGLQLSPTPQQYLRIAATGIPARLAIDLPEGPCSLRIAVHDLAAGRAGSLELPLQVSAK
jgi:VWFA-related protein